MAERDFSRLAYEYRQDFWRSPAAKYARERGLRHSTIDRFSLGYVGSGHYRGRMAIPYQDGMYRVRGIRYRALPGCRLNEVKYLAPYNQKAHIFAPRAADQAVAVICEGEMDAMSCWNVGIKACGIPGATMWQDHWALLFRNCDEVVLAFDADEAGAAGQRKVRRSLRQYGIDVRYPEVPEGNDINDLMLSGGAKAVKGALGLW